MSIFEYIRIKFKKFIDKKSNKRIGSGEEEQQTQEREEFRKKIKENPVYNRNSHIYNILKHYKFSEEFAKNIIVQEEVKSIIQDKIYSKYKHRNIDILSIEDILNILEGAITVSPNSITIRSSSLDEYSSQSYFINILKTRKGIKIREEDANVYKTCRATDKRYREYNKYNILMKKINETKSVDEYESDNDIHDIISITRSEENPFIMSYKREDILENAKYEGRIYYSDIDACLDLQEYNMYENGYELEMGKEEIPEYATRLLIKKLKLHDTSSAKNFLYFCRREYPEIFEDNQTIKE